MLHAKKLFAFVISVILCVSHLPEMVLAETDSGNQFVAEARMGQELIQTGFSKIEMGTDKNPNIAVRGDSYCWLMDKLQGDNKAFVNFSLSPDFKGTEKDGSVYEIEFEYYDAGEGFVRLVYDSESKPTEIAGTVYTQNRKAWRTAKFVLTDANFKNALDKVYDFRLTIKENGAGSSTSGESIAIRYVKVKRLAAKNPIYVSAWTDEAGDSFEWFRDEKIIHNRFENLTEQEKTVDVRYYLINEKHRIYFDKTETHTFAPGEVKMIDLDFGELDRSDIYTYHIEITSANHGIDSHFALFDVAVLKTDPNGIQNERVLYCAHLEWYGNEELKRDGIRLIKMSNSYGIRSSFDWNSMEPSKGVLDWNNHNMHFVVEELYRNGLHLIPSISGPSLYYAEAWNDMPRTAEQLDAWRRYIAYAAKTLQGYGVKEYEIWNEPNIANFNKYLEQCGGDVYTELLRIAAEEIKKVDPDALVGGPSVTGINGHWGQDYFTEAMDAGLYRYADAIAVHPYERTAPEICGMDENILWFKEQYQEKGIENPDVWNTEVGYTTADDTVSTEEMKGALNCRTVLLYQAMDLGERNCLYNFEKKGTILTDREDQFGSVGPASYELNKTGKPFVPTIAFAMVTGMNYIMAQSQADGIFDAQDKNVRINRYTSDKFNKKIVTVYTVNESETVSLRLGTDVITMYDALGNAKEIHGNNGVFTVLANNRPIYLVGDITDTELIENKVFLQFETGQIKAAPNDLLCIPVENFTQNNYTLHLNLPDNVELIENNGFNDGKAEVILRNNGMVGDVARITLNVMEEERVVACTEIDVVTEASVIPELSVYLNGENNTERWKADIDILNISQFRAAKGYLQFESPDAFKKLGKIDIGVIPKGKTGHIQFDLPEITRKGQYTLKYNISLDDNITYEFIDNIDFTIATHTEKSPQIDGIIETGEWNMNTAMFADDIGQIKQIENWGGTEDLSGRVCVMWDEENFYMCGVITDNIFSQDNQPSSNWQGDSIQFGVVYGEEGFLALGQGQTTFHEIGIALSPEGPAAYRFLSQDNCYPAGICETAKTAIRREENKTYYEFSLPWKDLLRPGDMPPGQGDRIGFSFLINDNDGTGRRGWIEYAGGIGEEKNAALFTYLELI